MLLEPKPFWDTWETTLFTSSLFVIAPGNDRLTSASKSDEVDVELSLRWGWCGCCFNAIAFAFFAKQPGEETVLQVDTDAAAAAALVLHICRCRQRRALPFAGRSVDLEMIMVKIVNLQTNASVEVGARRRVHAGCRRS